MAVIEQRPSAAPAASRAATFVRQLREFTGLLTRSPTALAGLSLVMFWVIIATFADDCLIQPRCWAQDPKFEATPWLARYSPFKQFDGPVLADPSADHWLGTDRNGRDLWSRLAQGSRTILALAPLAVLVALALGGSLGVIAGYYGGMIDEVTMRVLDAMLAFPNILLYMVIISALGPSPINVVIAITVAGLPGIARLVRSLTMDIRTRDYVAAAETRGESPWYIMYVEILPNASGPIMVDAMLRVGYAVFAIGTLGFLGLGLPPPSPDWGAIVNDGRAFIMAGHPWGALAGSLATASLVVSLNLMADGVNEELQRYR